MANDLHVVASGQDVRAGRAAPGTALATLAASMAAGQWAQMSPSGLSSALFNTATSNTLVYIDKGAYDPVARQIRFFGKGHLNDLRWHQYDEATDTWSNLADPPWDDGGSGAPSFIGHGYQHNTIDPATGDCYYRLPGSGTIHRFTRANGTWSTLAGPTTGATGVGAIEWLPGIGTQGGLVAVIYDKVQRWDKATNTWDTVQNLAAPRLDHPIAQRSVPNGFVLFGGGNGDGNLYSIGPTGGITARAACPVAMNCSVGVTVADPVSGKLIVVASSTSARVYDPTADTWATFNWPTSPAFPDLGAGNKVVAVPIAARGVIAFLMGSASPSPQMWLYKHA